MTLLDRAKSIPHGAKVIAGWLGSGGEVVEPETAQERADICLPCPNNVANFPVTTAVALAVKQYLGVKNKLSLRVKGEKALGTCSACGCVLRLKVWEPQEKVQNELTDEERQKLPAFCWQLR